jgi:hypothetical protein
MRVDKNSVKTPRKGVRERISHFYRSLPLFLDGADATSVRYRSIVTSDFLPLT